MVKGDVTITPRLDTHGAVNLILTDGSHLTAEWGINVKEGDTFTVYAQSTGEDTMGKLTACLSEDFNTTGASNTMYGRILGCPASEPVGAVEKPTVLSMK